MNVAEANVQTAKAQEKAAAAEVEVTSAQVQNAELQLSYTTVYAPTDGMLEEGQRDDWFGSAFIQRRNKDRAEVTNASFAPKLLRPILIRRLDR